MSLLRALDILWIRFRVTGSDPGVWPRIVSCHGRDNPPGHPNRRDNRKVNLELAFHKANMQDRWRDRDIREAQRLAAKKKESKERSE